VLSAAQNATTRIVLPRVHHRVRHGRPRSPALRLPKRVLRKLRRRARSQRAPHRSVVRARIIVLAAEGVATAEIARRVGVAESCVRTWRRRMVARPKLSTLRDRTRSGRPPRIPVPVRCELVKLACKRPADRPTAPLSEVWTREALRSALAKETGWKRSLSEITRTLRCAGLRPHRVRIWLHSPDPEFRPKVERICSLYLSPPRGATVLCVDEKTGMQALEHAHPMHFAGGCVRREFEYVRHHHAARRLQRPHRRGLRSLPSTHRGGTRRVPGRAGAEVRDRPRLHRLGQPQHPLRRPRCPLDPVQRAPWRPLPLGLHAEARLVGEPGGDMEVPDPSGDHQELRAVRRRARPRRVLLTPDDVQGH
jgi:transposase